MVVDFFQQSTCCMPVPVTPPCWIPTLPKSELMLNSCVLLHDVTPYHFKAYWNEIGNQLGGAGKLRNLTNFERTQRSRVKLLGVPN